MSQGVMKLSGGLEIMDMGNWLFMVKFNMESEGTKVIEGDP